jgi:hypothetical protein
MLPSLRATVTVKVRRSTCSTNEDLLTSDHFARGLRVTSSHLCYAIRLVWSSLIRELGCLIVSHAVLYHMGSVWLTCEEYKKSEKKNFCLVDDRIELKHGATSTPQYLSRAYVPSFLTRWNHKVNEARVISFDARIVTSWPGMRHYPSSIMVTSAATSRYCRGFLQHYPCFTCHNDLFLVCVQHRSPAGIAGGPVALEFLVTRGKFSL